MVRGAGKDRNHSIHGAGSGVDGVCACSAGRAICSISRVVTHYWMRLPLAVLRLLLELVPIVAFIAFAYGVLPDDGAEHDDAPRRPHHHQCEHHRAGRRCGRAGSIFSPKAAAIAPPERHRRDGQLHRHLGAAPRPPCRVYATTFSQRSAFSSASRAGIYGLLQRAIGLLVVAMVRDSRPAEPRSGDRPGSKGRAEGSPWSNMRQRIADVWHFLAIAYVFAVYGVWALDITGGVPVSVAGHTFSPWSSSLWSASSPRRFAA